MPMPSDAEVEQLGRQIDEMPELWGAGIGFVGDDACTVLRPSMHGSGLKTYVVLQEEEVPPPPAAPPKPSLAIEVVSSLLNCGGAVLAYSAMGGEALAAPASGGAALVLEGVTLWAARATTAQCLISVGRATDIAFNDGNWTEWVDSNEYYHWATVSLDIVSLAGAAASASAAVRAAKAIERATGKSWTVILKGMSRAERKRLAEELIRLKTPGVSGRGLKSLVRMGAFPKRLTSEEITERLFSQLKDAISATMALGGSGANGVLKEVYVHIIQE
ncbi:MAG: hypothetical protein ABUS79_09965 [Pseudomonadota bacterium]